MSKRECAFMAAWIIGGVAFRQWVIDLWPWTEAEIGRWAFAAFLGCSGMWLWRTTNPSQRSET